MNLMLNVKDADVEDVSVNHCEVDDVYVEDA